MIEKAKKTVNKIVIKRSVVRVVKAVLIAVMLVGIFLHLVNTDISTAPEFIYNQF